jgi:hypothetical protein
MYGPEHREGRDAEGGVGVDQLLPIAATGSSARNASDPDRRFSGAVVESRPCAASRLSRRSRVPSLNPPGRSLLWAGLYCPMVVGLGHTFRDLLGGEMNG